MPTPEELARQNIDALLQRCGWVIQDYKQLDLSAARGIAIREVRLQKGRCDYLLLIDRKPVGIIEAKKAGVTLSSVADQSGQYAENLPDFLRGSLTGRLPFLYESTGIETFFRNERDPHPRSRRVFAFHRPETLAAWLEQTDTLRRRLAEMPFAHPYNGDGVRVCRVEAITNPEQSFAEAQPRALIQMATGAGKTLTACAFTYRLIKHAGARNVLFLVDRANLGRQALAEFHQFVTPDTGRKFTELYNVQHLTSNHLDPVARVTICTIQRLYAMLRGEELNEDIDEKSGFEIAAAVGPVTQPSRLTSRAGFQPAASVLGVALGKRDEDTLTTLASRLARMEQALDATEKSHITAVTGGKTLSEMARALLQSVDPDAIAEKAAQKAGVEAHEVSSEALAQAREALIAEACSPFDKPEVRDTLVRVKQQSEQTIDVTTIDVVLDKGCDAAAKDKAENLIRSFRDYIAENQSEIDALQILYSRPYKQRLTEPMLKDLEKKLRENHAAWTEDRLWDAFAVTAPDKSKAAPKLAASPTSSPSSASRSNNNPSSRLSPTPSPNASTNGSWTNRNPEPSSRRSNSLGLTSCVTRSPRR